MPAAQESSVKALGVIAGSGLLPERLLKSCDKSGIESFVIAFEGQTDPAVYQGRRYLLTRLGAAGRIIDTLKAHGIHDLVLIGSIRRPALAELRPDLRTACFFAKLSFRAMGDDNLLKALRRELEQEGFRLHGVQDFIAELLAPEGVVGRIKPDKGAREDIVRGLEIARTLGQLDVGQSVIVQEGVVLGVEAIEGTDALIRRCGPLQRKGRGGILIKVSKPGQDRDLDLPTIGPETVRLCAEMGLAGIAIEAGNSLLIDPQEVGALANKSRLFVIGIDPERFSHAG